MLIDVYHYSTCVCVCLSQSQLRDSERERRRLMGDLAKERNCRDELEGLTADLRKQLSESRARVIEAESRATRLVRETAVIRDQVDELNSCRAELSLREEENALYVCVFLLLCFCFCSSVPETRHDTHQNGKSQPSMLNPKLL